MLYSKQSLVDYCSIVLISQCMQSYMRYITYNGTSTHVLCGVEYKGEKLSQGFCF